MGGEARVEESGVVSGDVAGGAQDEHAGPEGEAEADMVPLVIPEVVGEDGELEESAAGGGVPALSDVMSDIGKDPLNMSGMFGVPSGRSGSSVGISPGTGGSGGRF